MAAKSEDPVQPWELRLCAAVPLPPLATGAICFAVAVVASLLYYELVAGSPMWQPEARSFGALSEGRRNAVLAALLGGYVIGGLGHARFALARDLAELGAGDSAAAREIPKTHVARSRAFGALGTAILVSFVFGIQMTLSGPVTGAWLVEFAPFVFLQAINGWLIARVVYFAFVLNSELDEITQYEFDLLDLRPALLLGRIALRNSLLFIIGISILIPWMLVLPTLSRFLGIVIPLALIIPMLLLVLPVRGVRRKIRLAKAAALEELNAELRRVRDAAIPSEKGTPGRLADLLAYRSYVVSIRDWPFDSPTMMRFALYLLIPIGSWVGSAFVERVVNTALD